MSSEVVIEAVTTALSTSSTSMLPSPLSARLSALVSSHNSNFSACVGAEGGGNRFLKGVLFNAKLLP